MSTAIQLPNPAAREPRLASLVRAACLLEATAAKFGNVHPAAAFADLCYRDFVQSAEAIAPVLAETRRLGVGPAILEAVRATRRCVSSNTNLGIILLLAPLAAVPAETRLTVGLEAVLCGLTRADADAAYEAIRLACPGGMGRADKQDVSEAPSATLLEVMRLAADRDLVAAQYATSFSTVLGAGLPYLQDRAGEFAADWERVVLGLQLHLLAREPDTLIVRKCGAEVAQQVSERAREVLEAGWPESGSGQALAAEFDAWLRADGHRRNPGTTADLVTASLFAALRDGSLPLPRIEGV